MVPLGRSAFLFIAVTIHLGTNSSPGCAAAVPTYLGRSSDFAVSATTVHYDPLYREILRQALLAELRERYGVELRDAWLGEAPSTDSPEQSLDVAMSPGKTNLIEILCGVPPAQESRARFGLAMPDKLPLSYVTFLADVERLMREEVAPKTAEVTGLQQPRTAAAPIDMTTQREQTARLESLVNDLTLPTQFAAARELHALIKQHGEVPEFVGLLVRAYAHLGLFAEPYCSRMQYVFKARALVYAQRWLAREPQSALAAEHRAYALAVIGLQASALDDLTEAARRRGTTEGDARASRWALIIDAYCRYQMTTLAGIDAMSPDRQLAMLLRYMAAEESADARRVKTAAIEAQQAAPECYYLFDVFGHPNTYSYDFEYSNFPRQETQRAMYETQRNTLGSRLYARVQAMSGLPPTVVELFKGDDAQTPPPTSPAEYALRGRLIETLIATPNIDEPLSWSLLGRLIQEESFRQALLSDEEDEQAHGDLPPAMVPLVAHHRLRPYFQVRNTRAPNRLEPLEKLIAAIDLEAIDRVTMRLLHVLSPGDGAYNTAKATKMYGKAADASSTDGRTLRDVFYNIARDTHFPPKEYVVQRVLDVDPYCPRAVYLALKYYPAKYEPRWESWKPLSGEYPEIEAVLAVQLALKEPAAVQEAKLQAAFNTTPDAATALRLAELQLARNDLDAWEQTLRTFATATGKSDEAVKACEGAATTLIERRLFDRALPFAEAAYQHHSSFGRRLAAQVYEAQQNWKSAERLYQESAQESFDFPFPWYFFCRRTGQGDMAAAFDLVDKYLKRSPPGTNWTAYYRRLQNENERAASSFRNLAQRGNPEYGLQAVLLHDELGLTAERDLLLETIRKQGPKYKDGPRGNERVRAGLVGLAKLIEADLKNGGKAEFDLAALEKLRTDNPPDQAHFDCVLGYYYDFHGQREKATAAWLRCMTSIDIDSPARTLAGTKLSSRSKTPADYRDALQGRGTTETKPE